MEELDSIFSDDELKQFTEKGAGIEIIKEYYNEFVSRPDVKIWLEDDDNWSGEADRKDMLVTYLRKEFLMRPPVKPMTIIPIGMDRVSTGKSGSVYSGLYIVDKKRTGENLEVKRIVVQGKVACDLLKKVMPFNRYKDVLLGDDENGNIFMDDRASHGFDTPEALPITSKQLIEKLELPRVPKLSEIGKYLSKRTADGYAIRTDLKIIRGMIKNDPWIKDEPYNEGGSCRLVDSSIDTNETRVTPEGKTIPPGISSWISPKLIKSRNGDTVDHIVVIEEVIDKKKNKKTGEISCNAICEIPVHQIPVPSGDDQ